MPERQHKWTDEEHTSFLEGLRLYGKDWGKVTEHIGTRSRALVASHAQSFRRHLAKDPTIEGADLIQILEAPIGRGRGRKPAISKLNTPSKNRKFATVPPQASSSLKTETEKDGNSLHDSSSEE